MRDRRLRNSKFNVLSWNYMRESRNAILRMFGFIISSYYRGRISIMLDCYRDGSNWTTNFYGRNASRYASLLIGTSRLMHLSMYRVQSCMYIYICMYILAVAIHSCIYWYLFNQSHIPPGLATYTSCIV